MEMKSKKKKKNDTQTNFVHNTRILLHILIEVKPRLWLFADLESLFVLSM